MHDKLCIITSEQKLLFDIRQLLIEQNELLRNYIKPTNQINQKDNEQENKIEALATIKANIKKGGR